MSETLTPDSVFRSVGQTTQPPALGLDMVGAYIPKPPQTADDHSKAFVVPHGILLNRSEQSTLWMTAQKLGWVQSEANWQAAKTLSVTGSVSFYSDGTDGTNFRTPDIGADGGFARWLGSSGVADVGGIETGFDWQIENITATFKSTKYNGGSSSGAFTDSGGSFGHTLPGGSYFTGGTTFNFDASRVVKAGNQTTPLGFYQKAFIYTGADIVSPPAMPSLEQILAASSARNLLLNTNLSSPINQNRFDGNWAALAIDAMGYDLWMKYDTNNIYQVIPDGEYSPNTEHILQINNIVVWRGNSPSSGIWGVVVPNTANRVDLREGSIKVPWRPPIYVEEIERISYQFERVHALNLQILIWNTTNVEAKVSIPVKPKVKNFDVTAGFTQVTHTRWTYKPHSDFGVIDSTDNDKAIGIVTVDCGVPEESYGYNSAVYLTRVNVEDNPYYYLNAVLVRADAAEWLTL